MSRQWKQILWEARLKQADKYKDRWLSGKNSPIVLLSSREALLVSRAGNKTQSCQSSRRVLRLGRGMMEGALKAVRFQSQARQFSPTPEGTGDKQLTQTAIVQIEKQRPREG